MGCMWSSESGSECHDRNLYTRSRSTSDLTYSENYVYTVQQTYVTRRRARSVPRPVPCSASQTRPQPLFGEYKCKACGRTWNSRLCWPNSYQICSRCKKHVYPHNQRPLLPSDSSGTAKDTQEHKKELCQMCQQLGYYCANFEKKSKFKRNL